VKSDSASVSGIFRDPGSGIRSEGRSCREAATRAELPDVLEQPVRRTLLVEIRKRRIGQRRENVIEDQAFHFGLRLFLFGPAVYLFDHLAPLW
jgi:hypothetical protein